MKNYIGILMACACAVSVQAQTTPTAPAAATAQTAATAPTTDIAVKTDAVAPVVATAVATPVVAATQVNVTAGSNLTLPANTELLLRLSQEVNSKRVKEGHVFRVAMAQDVMVGNYVILPKGTPGTGFVSYRTGKGAFGKSGKMEITMKSLDLPGGRSIGLNGMTRQEGQGNTGATVGALVAVGVFSAFVTGHSAVFQEGREVRGFTRDAVLVEIPK